MMLLILLGNLQVWIIREINLHAAYELGESPRAQIIVSPGQQVREWSRSQVSFPLWKL